MTLQTMNFVLQWAMPLLLLIVVAACGVLVFRFRSPNRRRYACWFFIALALFAACGLALNWSVNQEYIARREKERAVAYAKSSFVNVGDAVPSFIVTDTDGVTFSTDELRGSVLLINFFRRGVAHVDLNSPT